MTMNIHFKAPEEKVKIASTKELAEYILDSVNEEGEMTDEERRKMDAQIMSKLKSGKKLSQKEMRYLKKYNPIMYAHALRVQLLAKAVEEQLKHAKSKEEANRIISSAIGGISKNDPDREYIVAAMNRISKEMHKSVAYSRLPDTDADAQKAHKKKSEITFEDAEDSDEEGKDGFDPMSWSPLQEVFDAMPTFEAGA